MEPTPPEPVLVASVWADRSCTSRPIPGEELDTLYVRIEDPAPLNSGTGSIGSNPDTALQWETDSEVTPVQYGPVVLFIDWFSASFDIPFSSGDVIELFNPSENVTIPDVTFDYYL